jgi:uncharacterized protein
MNRTHEDLPPAEAIGAGIGLLNTASFATAGQGIGVTTPFEDVAALAAQRLAPDHPRIKRYLEHREEPPKIGWEAFLVLGVFLGSRLAAHESGERTRRAVPPEWQRRFGPDPVLRGFASFVGGALMMFGARMAKGCTSGHAITGNSQLAASSWLFGVVMGASAVATAQLLYGREARDGR